MTVTDCSIREAYTLHRNGTHTCLQRLSFSKRFYILTPTAGLWHGHLWPVVSPKAEPETRIWIQVVCLISRSTSRRVGKWDRERKEASTGDIDEQVAEVGQWGANPPGASGW